MTRSPMPLVMSDRRFRRMLRELHRRGEDRRESGAFLLAARDAHPLAGAREITRIFYYDDLDADCLTGGITMHATGLSRLNQLCKAHRLRVVGDVHTHPGKSVRQSRMDADHPMISLPGHVALIAPNYAAGIIGPDDLGAHRLLRGSTWEVAYGSDASDMIQIRSTFSLALARLSRIFTPFKET